jgi:RimJ/RimL family protein N-acetyltransferase
MWVKDISDSAAGETSVRDGRRLLVDEVLARRGGTFVPRRIEVRLTREHDDRTSPATPACAANRGSTGGVKGISEVTVSETERLRLRRISTADAAFILELLNDPSFIRNVGDRGIRTVEEACEYILSGPVASYERLGFGLYLVELKERSVGIGICGLLRRDSQPDVEIGFAFLPGFRGRGYAFEAASAVMKLGMQLRLERIVAVTAPDNHDSIKVLQKLGFKFERMIRLPDRADQSRLYSL